MRLRFLLPVMAVLLAGADTAETPAPQDTQRWAARHADKLRQVQSTAPALILVGDSITEELENTNPRFGDINGVWQRFFACHSALNLGFAGDTTGNVLWRLDHGEVAGIHPTLAVVLIGTNDISPRGGATPAEAAAGVQSVVAALHAHLPRTQLMVIGLLPRGRFDERRRAVNRALEAMDWAALHASFTEVDAVLERGGAPDPALYRETLLGRPVLHPNAAGWSAIATAIEPKLAAVLGHCPAE